MTTVIYFMKTVDGIRIGSGTHLRIKSHQSAGLKLLACLPGKEIEEKRLHAFFAADRAKVNGSNSIYKQTRELENYIVWLVKRGFAAPYYHAAERNLAELPFAMWEPPKADKVMPVAFNLFLNSPLEERIQMAWQDTEVVIEADDWYIPPEWADRARAVMGRIDLDPASCIEADRGCVKADKFYSKEVNGLDENSPWFGNIWLNPPYGRGDLCAAGFMARMCHEIRLGRIKQVISCVQDWSIGAAWFRPVLELPSAIHFIPNRRIQFIAPHGTGKANASPNKGNLFTYYGSNTMEFADIFGPHGTILQLWKP